MRTILALLLVLMVFSCGDPGINPNNLPTLRALSSSEAGVSQAESRFAFDLFRATQGPSAGNLFISPLSVSLALSMTLNGADGGTLDAMRNALWVGDLEIAEINQANKDLTALLLGMDNTVEIGIANSVWYQDEYSLNTAFAGDVHDYYDGRADGLNFADPHAKDVINGWVSDKTNGKIKNLLEGISSNEVMFLVNAIYFKGTWQYRFDKAETHDREFRRENGSIVNVPTMHLPNCDLEVMYNDRLTLVDLPYGNGQFSMTILLPNGETTVSEITGQLSHDSLQVWLSKANLISTQLEMPRFRMDWKNDLVGALSKMGMSVAFFASASFPNFFEDSPPLYISRVVHGTFVDVTEDGTEAAAATVVAMGVLSAIPTPYLLQINRPFIFIIRERHTQAVLFVGQLMDPSAL